VVRNDCGSADDHRHVVSWPRMDLDVAVGGYLLALPI
jgi:hypothetical protein